ncbi:MAG TPA: hypothetical protein PK961_09300 [bacterium]|nr:hypothetical protein [bacterium]
MKNKYGWIVAAMICAASLAGACDDIVMGEKCEDAVDDDTAVADDDDAGETELTWADFGAAFFADYCTRCHSDPPTGGAPYALETYEQVVARAGAVRAAAASSTSMPPSAPLPSDEERTSLGEWLDAGAPE